MNEIIRSRLNRLQRTGVVLGIIGLAACGLGAAVNGRQFFISYLVGYSFWLGLSLGCFAVTMIHHLTGGGWGFVTRRFLEAGFMTLPLMAVLFMPLLFGLADLYPWAQAERGRRQRNVASENGLSECSVVLRANDHFFCDLAGDGVLPAQMVPAAGRIADPAPTIRMRTLSGPGIVIYPLTATFAFVDWVMSAEPGWYSTMFPVIVLIGQILSAFAFVTLLLAWFSGATALSAKR